MNTHKPTHVSHPTPAERAETLRDERKAEKAEADRVERAEDAKAANAAKTATLDLTPPAAVPAKVSPPATFPARTEGFPKSAPRPSITVNGNVKTAKDGVKSEMTAGEIAALDGIPADRFVRVDYHGVRKEGTASLTEITQAIHIEDGMDLTAIGR